MQLRFAMPVLAIGLAAASPAAAAVTFDLSVVDPSAGLGSGPFGTVTVEESGGSLIFTETLNAAYRIHDGNANHNAFAFSLFGDPNLSISNLTAGFAAISVSSGTNVSAPPFGSFFTAIDCTTACGPGWGGGFTGPLTFTVSSSAGPLTLASLGYNTVSGQNIYFASDLVNAAGNTGNVGAIMSAVPEPASWAMMLGGFGLIGLAIRRRRGHEERHVLA